MLLAFNNDNTDSSQEGIWDTKSQFKVVRVFHAAEGAGRDPFYTFGKDSPAEEHENCEASVLRDLTSILIIHRESQAYSARASRRSHKQNTGEDQVHREVRRSPCASKA